MQDKPKTMSHYADYVRERTGDHIIETPHGFATYRYLNDGRTVYIIDIYVAPPYRQTSEATRLADEIVQEAKRAGATELIGTVVPSTKASTTSLKVLLGYGLVLASASDNLIVFRKEI